MDLYQSFVIKRNNFLTCSKLAKHQVHQQKIFMVFMCLLSNDNMITVLNVFSIWKAQNILIFSLEHQRGKKDGILCSNWYDFGSYVGKVISDGLLAIFIYFPVNNYNYPQTCFLHLLLVCSLSLREAVHIIFLSNAIATFY